LGFGVADGDTTGDGPGMGGIDARLDGVAPGVA
jgi:hypothetical protein